MKYSYQFEKLSKARFALMLPHPEGEAASIAYAFDQCKRGFDTLDVESISEDYVLDWIKTVQDMMDTSGYEDPRKIGKWRVKAETFDESQKIQLSRAINELANWFCVESHS